MSIVSAPAYLSPLLGIAAFVLIGCAGSGVAPSADQGASASLFSHLDRDGDGRVAAFEGAEALMFLTTEADADRDGALSAAELSAFLEDAAASDRAEREDLFAEFDADGDGRLTAEELPGELAAIVPVADLDGTGSLSLAELLATDAFDDPRYFFEGELLEFLGEVDADGDGAFALADMPADAQAEFAEQFAELDVNADGFVDKAELMALAEEDLRGATFVVDGTDAVMTGVIGPGSPGRVLELILEHPEVARIVMVNVPGSIDDDANVRAARLVRRAGLATFVPADGEVASGGTDFFQAGVVRTCGAGARFGVHSWAGPGIEGKDVPRDDSQHQMYLDFYREMGIPDEFYWYTLEAASADGIHWMTEEELERFDMLTE